MFKLNVKIFSLVIFLCVINLLPVNAYNIWQTVNLSYSDPHKVNFIAGNPEDGSYIISSGGIYYNSTKIYLTPKYRDQKLLDANKSTLKTIEKLQKKIDKSKAQNKNYSKDLSKKVLAESSLYHVRDFDSSNDFKILLLSRGYKDQLAATKFYQHQILDYKRRSVCKPLNQEIINLSEEDKQYLTKVYSIKNTDWPLSALIVKYDLDCFLQQKALQETVIYKSSSKDKYFQHYYGIFTKTKTVVKSDFGI